MNKKQTLTFCTSFVGQQYASYQMQPSSAYPNANAGYAQQGTYGQSSAYSSANAYSSAAGYSAAHQTGADSWNANYAAV